MNFWLIAALFTLIMAFVCFYPLLRRSKPSPQINRDELNKAFYFDRLKELEQGEKEGLLENAGQAKVELQQALLQDIPESQTAAENNQSFSKLWFVSGFLALGIIAVVAYSPVGGWKMQEMAVKSYEKLPYFYERLKEEESKPLTDEEILQFGTALRMKLQQQPQDAEGWWLLGQLGFSSGNLQLSADSYAKALQLEPDNTEYQLAYARVLMYSEDEADKAKAEEYLKQVIRKEHTNLAALSMLALRYFEREDYKMAIVSWAMMLKLLPENDPKRELLEKSIRSARDALNAQEEEKHKALTPNK
ncbi:c-type cytochrome biogenesis protein CcmI [Pasteurellaceae bacterium LIM206]|nr:c-type cytochrome biogenesis protein CcmI [Pasteurellaceae bacterium LIM206]